MAYLLDTHALLWWLADDVQLPEGVCNIVRTPQNEIFVSAATAWEIAIKRALGKLEAPEDLVSLLDDEGFQELPINFTHGQLAGRLPPLHRDPFDRMLIAQSQAQGLILLTRDENIPRYDVKIYWG